MKIKKNRRHSKRRVDTGIRLVTKTLGSKPKNKPHQAMSSISTPSQTYRPISFRWP